MSRVQKIMYKNDLINNNINLYEKVFVNNRNEVGLRPSLSKIKFLQLRLLNNILYTFDRQLKSEGSIKWCKRVDIISFMLGYDYE